MDKPIYIHLGPGKTGTSAIQNFFTINDKSLEENGFRYIKTLRYYVEGHRDIACHHPLAWLLHHKHYGTHLNIEGEPFVARRDQLLGELSDELYNAADKSIIMSSEIFPMLASEALDELMALCSNRPIKAIFYIRDFHAQAMSMASQVIKENVGESRLSDVHNHIHFMYSYYIRCLNLWTQRIGKSNITFRKYGARYFTNGRIYDDILDAIGTKLTQSFIIPDTFQNVSMSYCETIHFKDIINRLELASPNYILVNELLAWESCHSGTTFFMPQSITSQINEYATNVHSFLSLNYLDDTYNVLFGDPLYEGHDEEFHLSYSQFSGMLTYLECRIPGIKQDVMDSLRTALDRSYEHQLMLKQFENTFRMFTYRKKAVALWGCGDIADKLFKRHKCLRETSFYIIDKSTEKQGSIFWEREVLPPSFIKKANIDTVIIASYEFADEIAKEIEDSYPSVQYIIRLASFIAVLEQRDESTGKGEFRLKCVL